MPPVNVQDSAHSDTRLSACARALRMSRPGLLGNLIGVWSRVTEVGSAVMRANQVAAALHRRVELVVAALVDAELALELEGGLLDLEPLRSIYGDYEWYLESQGRPASGGRARATAAQREGGRFVAREWNRELPDALAGLGGTAHIADLAEAVGSQPKTIRPHLRLLVDGGTLVDLGHGRFTTGAGASADQRPVPEPGPAPVPAPTSATSTTAISPAIAHESIAAQARANARDQRRPAPDTGAGTSADQRPTPALVPAPPTAAAPAYERCERLYRFWLAVVAESKAKVRDPGPLAGHDQVLRAVNTAMLAGASEEDLRRGLELLGVQCRARLDAGIPDPWWPLQYAWTPEVLKRAMDCQDEATARERALRLSRGSGSGGRRGGTGGVRTAPNEHYETKDVPV
jgi:hypothetical protein